MTTYLLYMTMIYGSTVHTTVTEHSSLETCTYAARTHVDHLRNTTSWAYRVATTCARK